MAKTIEQLKAQGAEVKNATVVGENTATRVGTLFTDILEHVEQYEADGAYRTLDTEHNVGRVGQAMADRLNENGIRTIHDTTLNDVPGYNDAYERMAGVISGYLEAYPSIRMVIDLHRDSIETDDGGELALSVEVDGQQAAQLLFVMGTDIAGMEHPNWRCNLGFALQLQAYCQTCAPGLFRELSLRTQRYN